MVIFGDMRFLDQDLVRLQKMINFTTPVFQELKNIMEYFWIPRLTISSYLHEYFCKRTSNNFGDV